MSGLHAVKPGRDGAGSDVPLGMRHLDLDHAAARGFLLDMDGVVYRGDRPIPAARRFLAALDSRGIPWLMLTNHSCRTPAAIARVLGKMGIDAAPERILTAAQATAGWLARRGIRRVFAIGEAGLLQALADQGITIRERGAEAVVVGLDRQVGYAQLATAHRLIATGLPFIATNPDATYPGAEGDEPECGMLLAALVATTRRRPRIIGKPSRAMFVEACARIGLPPSALTMIGDRLDTDIRGARRAGIRAALVLTGHTTRAMLAISGIRPDLVLEDLSTGLAARRRRAKGTGARPSHAPANAETAR